MPFRIDHSPSGAVATDSGHVARVVGHVELMPVPGGVRPVRVPQREWWKLSPGWAAVSHLYSEASGVHLTARTEATSITLRVRCRMRRLPDGTCAPIGRFVAVVDGMEVASAPAPVTSYLTDAPLIDTDDIEEVAADAVVSFTDLPVGDKDVEVWFPQAMAVDLLDVDADAPLREPSPSTRPRWTHYGSSISHCVEADSPLGVWPVVAARAQDLELTNLGFRGACMLEPFMADTIAELPADVISLKVGINMIGGRTMSDRTFVPALHGMLDRIRVAHPNTPVILVSAISWHGSENAPGPSAPARGDDSVVRQHAGGNVADIAGGALTLARTRDLVRHVAAVRADRGERTLYLDGREVYGPGDARDLPLPDGLHPSSEGYREMGRRFADLVFGDNGLLPRRTLGETS